MNRALVLAMALAIGLPVTQAAEAQSMGGLGARAGAPALARADRHRGGRRHGPTGVERFERRLERARARGDQTGRDPWNTYTTAPAPRIARSHFAQSRLARSQLWSGSCWSNDCGAESFAAVPAAVSARVQQASAGTSAAASRAAPSARPAMRSLDSRVVVRGPAAPAATAYAHRVWRP